ncbi:MAG: methyltransferase domain-containing protein [Thermoplasmata archaeon]
MRENRWLAVFYDHMMNFFDRLGMRRWRKRLWSGVRGKLVLDAGSGPGSNQPFYPLKGRAVVLDADKHMLDRGRIRDKGGETTMILGDVENLPFKDEVFDTIVSSFLFCSLDNPEQGMKEFHRVLKPGGQLLLLEHGRSRGALGRFMYYVSIPLYRLFGDNITRDVLQKGTKAGFEKVSSSRLLLDVVKLIRMVKPA